MNWIKSSKRVQVSFLRELLKIYDAWAAQGGVRASLAGDDDDWMNDMYVARMPLQHSCRSSIPFRNDRSSGANWEFETLRGSPPVARTTPPRDSPDISTSPAIDMNDPFAAIQAQLAAQAPRSLRNLFDDPNATNTNIIGNVLQTSDLNGVSRSLSPSPFRSTTPGIQPTDGAGAPTPRPTHPRARHGAPVSRGPTPSPAQPPPSTSPDSPPKVLTYRDIRVNRGVLNIAIPSSTPEPPTPVLQNEQHDDDREHAITLSSPESDADATQHSPALRLPPAGMRSIPRQESETPVPYLSSPLGIAFPSVGPPSPIPPSIPSAPVATQDGSVPARHQAKTPSNPRIILRDLRQVYLRFGPLRRLHPRRHIPYLRLAVRITHLHRKGTEVILRVAEAGHFLRRSSH